MYLHGSSTPFSSTPFSSTPFSSTPAIVCAVFLWYYKHKPTHLLTALRYSIKVHILLHQICPLSSLFFLPFSSCLAPSHCSSCSKLENAGFHMTLFCLEQFHYLKNVQVGFPARVLTLLCQPSRLLFVHGPVLKGS